jgi:hypothetical protein
MDGRTGSGATRLGEGVESPGFTNELLLLACVFVFAAPSLIAVPMAPKTTTTPTIPTTIPTVRPLLARGGIGVTAPKVGAAWGAYGA